MISNLFIKNLPIAIYKICRKFPPWLFIYNQALLVYTDQIILPNQVNPEVCVTLADISLLNDICIVSGIQPWKVEYLLNRGVHCFLASHGYAPYSSSAWSSTGRCFIKGLGFEYDFGHDTEYIFWVITLPHDRGKGLYLKIAKKMADYSSARGIRRSYVFTEFTNTYSHSLFNKMGYRDFLQVSYVKFIFINICIIKNLDSGKRRFRFFFKSPAKDVTII
jgi:hypothetical protein